MSDPTTPYPPDAVGTDRASWSQRVRNVQLRRWQLSRADRDLIEDLFARLIVRGCHAEVTPAERLRVERIEKIMKELKC